MGSNKNLFIWLGVAVVALVATVMSGAFNMSEEPDFAQQMAERGGAVATPEPAVEPPPFQASTPPPPTPAAEEAPIVADSQDDDATPAEGGLENPCAGEESLGAEPEEAEEEGEMVASDGLDDPAEDSAVPDSDDEDLGLAAEDGEDSVPSDEDLFLEDEVSDDPIERFKEMDPRDIIDAKYRNLNELTTTPWNEEDPDNFIPMTGRPDPLTRVNEAIPDELMPPREGDTDESSIQLYAASLTATLIVDDISRRMRCINVLQVGLTKTASFIYGNMQFQLGVGAQRGIPFTAEGVSGNVIMTVSSISSDLVKVNFTAVADKVDLGISKTLHYIPRKGY